uniref:Uncharacterized protein n=1 Tax=Rhizophora mucronata TaxID=61149 RepID=A0A2P2NYR6_RHIMU
MFSEGSGGNLDKVSCDQGAGYNMAEMADQFSPECNALADICDPTPLLNSSMAMASLGSSNGANISRVQWCPGSTHLSYGSSLRWRSSPLTPMTQLDKTKRKELGSDSGLYGILEDDTPEILEESSTPVASVKASSPNKKRVSPPRPFHQLESGSSAVLKSGRKFILKSVPSFPPLTPIFCQFFH